MVSLLTLGVVLRFGLTRTGVRNAPDVAIGSVVVAICILAIAWAVWQSKRETA